MLTITLPENSPGYFETHATKFLEGLGKPYVLKKKGIDWTCRVKNSPKNQEFFFFLSFTSAYYLQTSKTVSRMPPSRVA